MRRFFVDSFFSSAGGRSRALAGLCAAVGVFGAVGCSDLKRLTNNLALVSFSMTASLLDSKSGKISSIPSPPTPRNLPMSQGIEDRLVLLAGVDSRGVVLPGVDVFDRKKGQWFSGAPWPGVRLGFGMASVGGKVCLYGGTAVGGDGSPLSTVDCFDVYRNTWATLPPMPVAMKRTHAEGFEGKVAVLGQGADQRPVLIWHDAGASTYTRISGVQMPSSDDPFAMDATGAYFLSGRNKAQDAKARPRFASYLLLRATGTSRNIESLPAPPSVPWEPDIAVHDGKLYVLGYGHKPTLQIFHIASQAWSDGVEPPAPLEEGSRMIQVGSRLVVMATPTSLAPRLSGSVWIYDTERNSWSKGERYAPPSGDLGVVMSESVGDSCLSISIHTKAGPTQAQQPASAPPLPVGSPPPRPAAPLSSAPPGASASSQPGASASAPPRSPASSASAPGSSPPASSGKAPR